MTCNQINIPIAYNPIPYISHPMNTSFFSFVALLLCVTTSLPLVNAQQVKPIAGDAAVGPKPIKAAFFVTNRLENENVTHTKHLQDLLSAELSDVGLRIVSPDATIKAVSEVTKDSGDGANPFASLSANNVQNLAQKLGAECFLMVSLNKLTKTIVDLPKFNRSIVTFRLRAGYRLSTSHDAASFKGNSFTVEKKVTLTPNINVLESSDDVLTSLIDDVVDRVSKDILESDLLNEKVSTKFTQSAQPAVRNPVAPGKLQGEMVSVTIEAKMQGLKFPEIVRDDKGNLLVTGKELDVTSTDAEIEVDGVFVGNASAEKKLAIPKGLRRLVIKRPGYTSPERIINAYEGMSLSVLIKPTAEEYKEWNSQMLFLQSVKERQALSEDKSKLTEGFYEFLKNSQYEVPDINLHKSLF